MLLRLIVLLMFVVLGLTPTQAARRVALVIGNNAYANLPAERQLKKAVNDARAMRDTLTAELGFDVLYGEDVDWVRMDGLIKQLETKIGDGDVVFVYFSGHGVSVGGENYLLPSDIPLPRQGQESRLIGNSFGAEAITQRIQKRGAQAIFAVLDACRDNPFVDDGGKAVGGSGGLTTIDKARGVFTLFAAGIGEVALDRLSNDDPDPNSVFTRSLIPLLRTGGLSQVDLAKKVQQEVVTAAAAIGHNQMPVYDDGLLGFVALKEGGPEPKLDAPPKNDPDPVAADYQLARDIGTTEAWDAFLAKHGSVTGSFYVDLAKAARQKLALNVLPPPKIEPNNADCDGVLLASTGGAAKCLKPGDEFADCDGCPTMVVIPAGSFIMGSPVSEKDRGDDEGPQHKVTIGKAFGAGKFEMTRGQYARFVEETGHQAGNSCWVFNGSEWKNTKGKSFRDPGFKQIDDHPVACVSWDDAQAYVEWLTQKAGVTYRLLSESEWEYAARAGTTTPFSTGETITTDQANFNGNYTYNGSDKGQYRERTVEAGSFAANSFGLHDMHGNVWEWVEDCHEDSYRGAPDDGTASKDKSGCIRVIRGGSWFIDPRGLRSAYRYRDSPDVRFFNLGFRLARTL